MKDKTPPGVSQYEMTELAPRTRIISGFWGPSPARGSLARIRGLLNERPTRDILSERPVRDARAEHSFRDVLAEEPFPTIETPDDDEPLTPPRSPEPAVKISPSSYEVEFGSPPSALAQESYCFFRQLILAPVWKPKWFKDMDRAFHIALPYYGRELRNLLCYRTDPAPEWLTWVRAVELYAM